MFTLKVRVRVRVRARVRVRVSVRAAGMRTTGAKTSEERESGTYLVRVRVARVGFGFG